MRAHMCHVQLPSGKLSCALHRDRGCAGDGWKVARGAAHFRRFVAVMQQETSRGTCPVGLLPATFDAEYVAGAVAPFLLSSTYVGETPSLPMIDLPLSKENAVPAYMWGMLYDG